MSISLQGSGTSFNFGAYGFVVNLLWANIPLRWAISATKASANDVDFLVSAQQVQPTTTGAQIYQYTSGPFIAGPQDVPTAKQVYTNFSNYWKNGGQTAINNIVSNCPVSNCEKYIPGGGYPAVVVHQTLASTVADIRYTLLFKPKVGVLTSTSQYYYIHMDVMIMAGLTLGVHYANLSILDTQNVGANSCFTMLAEPHWTPDWNTGSAFDAQVKIFLYSGGNFFGECAGIATYEQCGYRLGYNGSTPMSNEYVNYNANAQYHGGNSPYDCNSLFITNGGFSAPCNGASLGMCDTSYAFQPSGSGPFTNLKWVNAYAQFQSWTWTSGYIDAMDLAYKNQDGYNSYFKTIINQNGVNVSLGYMIVQEPDPQSNRPNGLFFAAQGKLSAFFGQPGGNIFYLTGHDYMGAEGGTRAMLNAMLHPSVRPPNCGFTIVPAFSCIEFNPWAYASYLFEPGCVPTIPLDPGVGTNVKTCAPGTFIAVPPGWQVVPMDATWANQQSVVQQFASTWLDSTCIAGAKTSSTLIETSQQGYTATGSSCSVGALNVTYDSSGNKCYNVSGCNGDAILIYYPTIDSTCNANNYGVFCIPTFGGAYYNSSLSTNPSTIYIDLASGHPLPVPFFIPLYNRINIYVLLDSYNVLTSGWGDLASLEGTLQYIWITPNLGYTALAVGYGYIPTGGTNFVTGQSLTWSQAVMGAAAAPAVAMQSGSAATVNGYSTPDSPAIIALTGIYTTNTIAWFGNTYRVVWLCTKSNPRVSSAANIASLQAAMNGPGKGIILVVNTPITQLTAAWNWYIKNYNLPYAVAVTMSAWVDQSGGSLPPPPHIKLLLLNGFLRPSSVL